ncbi:MAG: response regulator [Proteobacteria bacterium]|nr:response regulator [Pseudomonadota bacterium]
MPRLENPSPSLQPLHFKLEFALQKYKILLADSDLRLGAVLKNMLEAMGFSDITLCRGGDEALNLLRAKPYDFVITEWQLQGMSGMELLQAIRRGTGNPDPSLPVIVLSGRREQSDVMMARDYGMNEFVAKPYTAQTVFQRLERMIEHPRTFVVSHGFVGPDRRFNGKPPQGVEDRRALRIAPQIRPTTPSGRLERGAAAQIWAIDTSLKKKLGNQTSLSNLIPSASIEKAQSTVTAISNEALLWIQESLNQLSEYQRVMTSGENIYTLLPINMSEAALTISARAGMFGFDAASKVAYMLHKFCHNRLRMEKKGHHIITEMHLDALKATLKNAREQKDPGAANALVIKELQILTSKLTA